MLGRGKAPGVRSTVTHRDTRPAEPREANDPYPSPEAAGQGQKTDAGCDAVPLMAMSPSHTTTTSESKKPFQAPNTHQASFKSVFTGSQHFVVTDKQEGSSDCRKRGLGAGVQAKRRVCVT